MNVWRRFFWTLTAAAGGGAAALYAFIVVVDPFDTLHLSPGFERGPIATNARYSFPALARSAKFDSAIIGTSTSRMLRPAQLNPLFGARFANLSMNDARAYEQYRLGLLFAEAHPDAKFALVGLDVVWCVRGDTFEKFSPRPFPLWMYDRSKWNDYAEHFSLYALEQAIKQFAELTGLVRPRYGRDGYTSFLPDEATYDLARARRHLYPRGKRAVPAADRPASMSAAERAALKFPTHPLLAELLGAFGPQTRVLLYFVPYHFARQPREGSREANAWEECKTRIARIAARRPNTVVVDFMFESEVTREDSNYWDHLHYRAAVADWLGRALYAAASGDHGGRREGFVVVRAE
jgi:hypothetical protein